MLQTHQFKNAGGFMLEKKLKALLSRKQKQLFLTFWVQTSFYCFYSLHSQTFQKIKHCIKYHQANLNKELCADVFLLPNMW